MSAADVPEVHRSRRTLRRAAVEGFVIPSMRPEPKRDGYGRYLLPDPRTGQVTSWTRATTLAHTLSDEFHLTQWKRRKVAEGLARRPELLSQVESLSLLLEEVSGDWRRAKPVKASLDALCDEAAAAAGANAGSEMGTALHSLTEWWDAGRIREIQVPEELEGDLDAYAAGMAAAGIERPPEYIERIVINLQVESAGTFDRLLRVPGRDKLVIGDLKTQKTTDFGFLEAAVQFAEYAYADVMVSADGSQLEPMPEVDREVGLLLHLPVGRAHLTIYEVDLTEGWHAATLAYEARQIRARSRAMGRRWNPPAKMPGDRLLYLISNAGHARALDALWRDNRGHWTEEHTAAARRRKEALGS